MENEESSYTNLVMWSLLYVPSQESHIWVSTIAT